MFPRENSSEKPFLASQVKYKKRRTRLIWNLNEHDSRQIYDYGLQWGLCSFQ